MSSTIMAFTAPFPLTSLAVNGVWHHQRQGRRSVCTASTKPSPPEPGNAKKTARRRKPANYWTNQNNLQQELLNFQQQHNPQHTNIMPSALQLRSHGRRDLENAIHRHGGYRSVAKSLGWDLPRLSRRPPGYWNSFENLERELFQFVLANQQNKTQMPTQNELKLADRSDIAQAIDKNGGYHVVASRLQLNRQSTTKPKHYWHDWTRVEHELRDYVRHREQLKNVITLQTAENQVRMPSRRELIEAGKGDLLQAITDHHGGLRTVGRKLGYSLNRRDAYYNFANFYNLARELYVFSELVGTNGLMPTTTVLKKHGRTDISAGILKHGGMASVSTRIGLQYYLRTKGALKDWSRFRNELEIFMSQNNSSGIIPSPRMLLNYGRRDLYQAMLHHGGAQNVEDRMGLKRSYWHNFASIGFDVLKFIDVHGTQGIMPTEREFNLVGRSSLNFAVEKMGSSLVAERLGLREVAQSNRLVFDALFSARTEEDNSPFEFQGEEIDMNKLREDIVRTGLITESGMKDKLANALRAMNIESKIELTEKNDL